MERGFVPGCTHLTLGYLRLLLLVRGCGPLCCFPVWSLGCYTYRKELYNFLAGVILFVLLIAAILLMSETVLSGRVFDQLYQLDLIQDHHGHELYLPAVMD